MRSTYIFSQKQIESFLLGECEEQLALRIEESLFSDDEFYRQMQHAKASLVTRYINGTLPHSLAHKFNVQIQHSPALLAEVERAKATGAPIQKLNSRPSLVVLLSRLTTRPFLRMAFVSMLLVFVAYFFVRPIVWNPASRSSPLSKSVSDAEGTLKVQTARTKPAVFFLSAGVLRNDSNVPVLHLQKSDQLVELQIEVREAQPVYRSLTILQASVPVFRQNNIEVKTEGPLHFVIASLPSEILPSGQYIARLEVDSSSEGSASATVYRAFQVIAY